MQEIFKILEKKQSLEGGMNILFATDKGYLEHMEDCIRSFARFETGGGYDVYILHSDLDKEDEKRLEKEFTKNIRLHFICIDPKGKLPFPESDRYPGQIYYRIFAAFHKCIISEAVKYPFS